MCGLAYSAAKRHEKESTMEKLVAMNKRAKSDCMPISFDEKDAANLADLHHDGLVISLTIGNCLLRSVLVDNDISANILILDALKAMGLSEGDITKKSTVLVDFSGEAKNTLGEITLPTYAQGVNIQLKFLVIDCLSSYNIIVGRHWIHYMKVAPST